VNFREKGGNSSARPLPPASALIYSDQEVARLVRAAARLPSARGLRAHTYVTLFGLLAATGLRLGEALALDRDDVDLQAGVLAIRRTKFGKSRFVPVHASTRRALARYAAQRDVRVPHPTSPAAFLLAERGTRLTQCSARYTFVVVSRGR
jgi:integrase/recombinase XerD